jgi:hypothetical protein
MITSCKRNGSVDAMRIRDAAVPVRKKLLVTGCGRSGTQFSAVLFSGLGVEIGHERVRRDGIASWCMAADADAVPWGEPRTRFSFEHVFHQIRHPLAVIESSSTLKPSSWEFICAHTPCHPADPPVERAAKYWLCWNRLAEAIATTSFRIENVVDELGRLCGVLGVADDTSVLSRVPTNLNTRRFGRALHLHDELERRTPIRFPAAVRRSLTRTAGPGRPSLTWSELARLAPGQCEELREQARAYGYDD